VTEAKIEHDEGWTFRGTEGSLFLDLAPGESTTLVIMATPPATDAPRRASRSSERQGERVLGGNTYLLRPEVSNR